jgi:hypothetical protein
VIVSQAVHLFFPSVFAHWGTTTIGIRTGLPFGFQDDGILDTRLVVSRDGTHLHYSDAANGRSSFLTLGINDCGPTASAPGVEGGWCSPYSGAESRTAFDTSNIYMASGWLPSVDGNEVYLYYAGEPFTHGDALTNHTFQNNTGVGMLKLRKVTSTTRCRHAAMILQLVGKAHSIVLV